MKNKHWLQLILDEHNTTAYAVAQRSGLPYNTLYRLLRRNSALGDLNISTVDGIARGLGMDGIKEFLDQYWDILNTLD